MVPQSELNTRLAALQQALDVEGLDAALVVQHADLFYFCGAVNRAILYVPTAGTPLLFALPGSERIREETLFPRIENLSRQENLPALLQEHGYALPKSIGLESDVLPAALHSRLAGLFPGARLADVSGSIRRIRMVKSAWEIEQISQACQMGQQIFDFVPQVLYQQISELELTGQGQVRSIGLNISSTVTFAYNKNKVQKLFYPSLYCHQLAYASDPSNGYFIESKPVGAV